MMVYQRDMVSPYYGKKSVVCGVRIPAGTTERR
jgi:hypothetical protein